MIILITKSLFIILSASLVKFYKAWPPLVINFEAETVYNIFFFTRNDGRTNRSYLMRILSMGFSKMTQAGISGHSLDVSP